MSPRILRAVLWYERGGTIEAEAELRAAMAEGEESSDLHAMIGLCLLRAGLREWAKSEIEMALRLEPNNAFAHYALSFVQQTVLEHRTAPLLLLGGIPINPIEQRACLRAASQAVELAPDEERYLVRLAEVHQRLGEWRKSLGPAERALSLSPDNVPAAILLAEALARTGRSQEARATLLRALEMNPEASAAHAGMGWAMLRARDCNRATEFFDNALRLNASLEWAQEGALECAKHRYRLYRWKSWLKSWFGGRSLLTRAALGLAAIGFLLLALVGLLELLDAIVRPRLGNKGTGLLFVPIIFCLLFLILFHDYLFLWLARRQRAALSTSGERKKRFVRFHVGLTVVSVAGAFVLILVGEFATDWLPPLVGLIPGGFLIWLTSTQFPPGVPRRGWAIYSAAVLLLGPIVGVLFQVPLRELGSSSILILLLLPVMPLVIAIEFYKKRELARKHDASLAARSRKMDSDSR